MDKKSTRDTKIGLNIQRVRLRLNMTQAEVAKKSDLSTNYYARIERGDATASTEALENIVHALKVKSSEILPF